MNKFLPIIALLLLSGCVTNKGLIKLQQASIESKKIIILKDHPTRESVLPVLENWFYENGYSAKVVQSLGEVNPEDYVFSYRAKWSWDMATYMRDVEMKLKVKGETLGDLKFDSLQYGGFGKFGDAETRLKIMLDVLFGKITREEADKQLGKA